MRNGILPPNIKIIYNTRYTLPCAEPESSGDDQIVNNPLEALEDGPEEKRSLSPLPYAVSESSGDDQIESDSLEALADSQEEKRWEIPLIVRPNDMTGKHHKRTRFPLVRVQVLGEEGKVEPKRESMLIQSPSTGAGLEGSKQLYPKI